MIMFYGFNFIMLILIVVFTVFLSNDFASHFGQKHLLNTLTLTQGHLLSSLSHNPEIPKDFEAKIAGILIRPWTISLSFFPRQT